MNGSIMGWFSLPESLEYTENFLSGSYRDRMAEHMLSEAKNLAYFYIYCGYVQVQSCFSLGLLWVFIGIESAFLHSHCVFQKEDKNISLVKLYFNDGVFQVPVLVSSQCS